MEKSCMEDTPKPKQKHANTDLEEFIHSFDNWQHQTEGLMKEKSKLVEDIKTVSHDKDILTSQNQELQEQISCLQTILDTTHKSLHRICDIEEENRTLKGKLENLETEICTLNSKIEEKEKIHINEIQEIKNESEKQKEEVKNSMKLLLEQGGEIHQSQINEKLSEIENLKEKLIQVGKENEAEVVKISMEYENKLTKLRQKIPSSTAHGPSSNQEIFRMKLQHMKNEYEREVRLLKDRIQELEGQVNFPQGQGVNGQRMTFTANKKRRF